SAVAVSAAAAAPKTILPFVTSFSFSRGGGARRLSRAPPPSCAALPCLRHLVALRRVRHVGERVRERLVVRVHAVTQTVVRALVRQPERGVQESPIPLGKGTEIDVDDVVLEPASVRVSTEVGHR